MLKNAQIMSMNSAIFGVKIRENIPSALIA